MSTSASATVSALALKTGDLIVTCGGRLSDGRVAKRYRIGARVEEVWAAPGARTLVHMRLDNGSTFKLRHDYPMDIVPADELAAALVAQAERVAAVKDDPAFQARIAARRAARR